MRVKGIIRRIASGYAAGISLLLVTIVLSMVSFERIWVPQKLLTIAVNQGVTTVPLKIIAKQFTDKYKIPTEVVELSYEELYKNEKSQLRQRPTRKYGEMPPFDVMLVDDPWLPEFLVDPQSSGADAWGLERLRPDEFTDYDVSDFVESTRSVVQYIDCSHGPCNSSYYALPFIGNSQLFCYHSPDFLKGPPKTWDDVRKQSERNQQGTDDRLGYVTRIGPGNSIVTDFLPILWAYDKDSLSPTGTTGLPNMKKAGDAFNMLSGLVGNRDLGDASMDDFDVAAYLAKGRATMGVVWNAWAMMLMSVAGKDLECGDLPGGPAGHEPELGTWVLAIPSNADANQKERAKKFIEFATRREQILLAAALGNPPPRKSVLRTLIDKQSPRYYRKVFPPYSPLLTSSGTIECRYRRLFEAQYRSLQQARPRPRSRCWRAVEQALGENLEQFVVRNRVEQEDVERVQKEVNGLLDSPQCSMASQQAPQVGSQKILDTSDKLDKECPPQNH